MGIDGRLSEHLKQIGTAPFLFVGSGLSRRYIGLGDWERLLRRFSGSLPKPYEYYKARANGNLPGTASKLAEAFFDVWWNDQKYAESRGHFQGSISDASSCLKFEISTYIGERKYAAGEDEQVDKEIELLKAATIDGIITTNWDTLLESVFPEFEVYVGQEQVLFSASQGIAELYKIHGCVTEPDSLVLTAEDYEDFNNRNAYLAAKLLTIFVEHPVIFLGYSLSDENIREILRQVASCLTNENIKQLQDRLIFVQWDAAGKGDSFESSLLQIESYSLPVTIIRTADFCNIYGPLCNVRRRFSARLLRKMKEHIYELVKSNDPRERLAVIDINDAESFKDLEVVYGVGIGPRLGGQGYTPISRVDLLKDVMSPQSKYDAKRIVDETLPGLLKQAKYVPMFRYLRAGGYIQGDGTINQSLLGSRVAEAAKASHESFYPPQQYRSELNEVQRMLKCVEAVITRYPGNSFFFIPMLKKEQIDKKDLRQYILGSLNLLTSKNTTNSTYFRSLICFYDWLEYR